MIGSIVIMQDTQQTRTRNMPGREGTDLAWSR
jgi:hypothetical protein